MQHVILKPSSRSLIAPRSARQRRGVSMHACAATREPTAATQGETKRGVIAPAAGPFAARAAAALCAAGAAALRTQPHCRRERQHAHPSQSVTVACHPHPRPPPPACRAPISSHSASPAAAAHHSSSVQHALKVSCGGCAPTAACAAYPRLPAIGRLRLQRSPRRSRFGSTAIHRQRLHPQRSCAAPVTYFP